MAGLGWFEEDGAPLPTMLPEWDPATDLGLYRDFELDTAAIAGDCRLEEGSTVRLGMTWSSDARVRVAVEEHIVELDGESQPVRLSVSVPGDQVAGRLFLKTYLWVVDARPESSLSPVEEGDLIWFDQHTTLLESDAARFPVTVMDFDGAIGVDADAFWYLSWPTRRFEEPFGASLRLLINTKKPDFVAAVQTDSDSEASEAIRRHIFTDTARTLIDFGLGSDEFLEDHSEYPEGSVGRAIDELINVCWGDSYSPKTVRAMRNEKPQVFESHLQSRLMGGF